MNKSIQIKMNSKLIFRLEISGSKEIIENLTNDVFFNSNLREISKKLMESEIKEYANNKKA